MAETMNVKQPRKEKMCTKCGWTEQEQNGIAAGQTGLREQSRGGRKQMNESIDLDCFVSCGIWMMRLTFEETTKSLPHTMSTPKSRKKARSSRERWERADIGGTDKTDGSTQQKKGQCVRNDDCDARNWRGAVNGMVCMSWCEKCSRNIIGGLDEMHVWSENGRRAATKWSFKSVHKRGKL